MSSPGEKRDQCERFAMSGKSASRDARARLPVLPFRGWERQTIAQIAPLARHHVGETAQCGRSADDPTCRSRRTEPAKRPKGKRKAYPAPYQSDPERNDQRDCQPLYLARHDRARTPARKMISK